MKLVCVKPFTVGRESFKKGDPADQFKLWPKNIQFKFRGHVKAIEEPVEPEVPIVPEEPVNVDAELQTS